MVHSVDTAEIRAIVASASARTGPLTLGQRNVLRWIHRETDGRSRCIPGFTEVPAGRSVAEIAEAIGALLARHEALRTHYLPGADGEPVQRVLPEGSVPIEVREVVGDAHAFVLDVLAVALARPFEVDRGLPVRVTVFTGGGAPFLVMCTVSHVAVDVGGAEVLARQLRTLLDGAALDTPPHQPIEHAAWENSAAGLRRRAAALEHWSTQLNRMPQAMFALPPHPDGTPGYREALLRSRALAMAVRTLPVSPSAAVLAAGVVLAALYTDTPSGAFISVCGNRFRPLWRDYVGTIAQDAIIPFAVGRDATFLDIARRLQLDAMNAYRYAQFDAARLWEIIDAVCARRGTSFHRDWVFNDIGVHADRRSTEPAPLDADSLVRAIEETTVEFVTDADLPAAFFLTLAGVSDDCVDIRLYADTEFLPPHGITGFLLAMERLLVTAALRPVRIDEIGELTGITPVERDGADWVRVDSCWVSIAATTALLHTVPGIKNARVWHDNGQLIAYLVGDFALRPADVHRAALAALPGRPAAMCPHEYVVCTSLPHNPDDREAWRRQSVSSAGTGRDENTESIVDIKNPVS
ncbi:MAG TPA: condensation domain-containing protein [Pseudonocardiaceae bacterium]|jgi:hypothetical protein|nr:condensation domain-containing protein [Pseudonocardiaceae bacterium]